MTVTVRSTFTNRFNPAETVVIETRVTDRMEERKTHKQSYGAMKNVDKFDRNRKRYTMNETTGKYFMLWNVKHETI